ncbi:hypothetical protein [Legionella jamestowniensis]|uniref:Uncharacterized protein n=1 Tax=Legionella jamestowniensis TaxID=455 RepID=A0A0W0UGC5_9GAMM|nr:hypothetical protein [Legionella jamestowniensis]KTD06976.1 hypothetical protein Ljam_1171 [Legionella jamestowniensis]SFM04311.1 hypothetical protein SAMN02746073_0115 [Legionella jamestowniensis DSM 19215]
MKELVRKFEAKSDEGKSVLILEYRGIKDILIPPDKEEMPMYGLPTYTTANGQEVIKVNGGYQILGLDTLFYEND